MKKIILSLVSLLTISFQVLAADGPAIEARGVLQSGQGPCSIKVQKYSSDEENPYYDVTVTTNEYQFELSNVMLDNGYFQEESELFEKNGDTYRMVIAPLFPFPKLYKVTVKNLGNNEFSTRRTTLIFNVPTYSTTDVCLTR